MEWTVLVTKVSSNQQPVVINYFCLSRKEEERWETDD